MKHHIYIAIIFIFLCLALICFAPVVHGQAPAPDSYEENDTLTAASAIPVGAELGNLTISPANDPDWFRVLVSPPAAYPGTYRAEVIGTPGLDLTLTVYGPNASPVGSQNDPSSPSAAVTFNAGSEGYYAFEITSATANEGWYVLRVVNLTPTPTPIPTITPIPTTTATLLPTATSPFLTNTPTPYLSGAPDYTEPNYDFRTAYRIVPGDTLENLNFNPGVSNAIDNDFFVMAVRIGVTYTCRTEKLGPSLDTNLIIFNGANTQDVIGGNDDINTQAGQINSQLSFTASKEGDVYVLVGYKYDDPNVRLPGNATYTFSCQAAPPTPTAMPASGGSSSGPVEMTPIFVEVLQTPEISPTATAAPVMPQTIDVIVGYDRNNNGELDPTEGVAGMSVRVIDAAANRELSHGFTSEVGTVRFTLAVAGPIRVVIPFLGAAEEFRPGSPVQWTILIPASNAPGLIP